MNLHTLSFTVLASVAAAPLLGHAAGTSSAGASSTGQAGMRAVEADVRCGGVGLGESNELKAAARDYALMLTFATPEGAYLADAAVDIRDSSGHNVVQTRCNGPILLVNLRPGTYRVAVQVGDRAQTRTVRIPERGTARQLFAFSSPGDDLGRGGQREMSRSQTATTR